MLRTHVLHLGTVVSLFKRGVLFKKVQKSIWESYCLRTHFQPDTHTCQGILLCVDARSAHASVHMICAVEVWNYCGCSAERAYVPAVENGGFSQILFPRAWYEFGSILTKSDPESSIEIT